MGGPEVPNPPRGKLTTHPLPQIKSNPSQQPSLTLSSDSKSARLTPAHLWEGKFSHCEIDPQVAVQARSFFAQRPTSTSTHNQNPNLEQDAPLLESQGKLQEAIWLYAETGQPEDSRKSQRLKEELRAILSEGNYTVSPKQLGGTVPKKHLIFNRGVEGVFKDGRSNPDMPWSNPNAEVAAFLLDDLLLDTHLVPMTVFREIDGIPGTVQVFMQNAETAKPEIILAPHFPALAYLDHLIGNSDRKLDNTLFLPHLNRIVAIDNGNSFHSDFHCLDSVSVQTYLQDTPKITQKLLRIQPHDLDSSLAQVLSQNELDYLKDSVQSLQRNMKSAQCKLKIHPQRLSQTQLARLNVFGPGAHCYLPPPEQLNEDKHSIKILHSLHALDPGKTYEYTLTTRGEWNLIEIVQPQLKTIYETQVAQGRAVLVAGNLKIVGPGRYQYNLQNKTLMFPFLKIHNDYAKLLGRRLRALFLQELGHDGEFVEPNLTPLF